MSYQEFAPSRFLQPFVACYWQISYSQQERLVQTILPDGCADIIFNFGTPFTSVAAGEKSVNDLNGFIVGSMTRPVISESTNGFDIMGIRFKPGGMYPFIHIPLTEFTDTVCDLQTFNLFNSWYEQLSGVTDSVERLGKIDALLTEIYKPSHEPNFTAALHIILKTRGYIRMKELSASIGLSQRQLERIFQKRSGLTPKQMASITQFQYMANLVRNRGEESLFDLAIQGGYTDHAHFSKAFKIFSGVSPSDFIK